MDYDYDDYNYYDQLTPEEIYLLQEMEQAEKIKQHEPEIKQLGGIPLLQQQSMKSDKKVIKIDQISDEGFDYLIQSSQWAQIETAIMQDKSRVNIRLGKLLNYILNIFHFCDGEELSKIQYCLIFLVIQEQGESIIQGTQILVQNLYLITHTEVRCQIDDSYQILIKIDKQIINYLLKLLMKSTKNLTVEQQQLRQYFPRLLITLIKPPQPLIFTVEPKECQAFIFQQMEDIFLSNENQYFESSQLDILSFVFFCESRRPPPQLLNIVNLLSAFLESFLECSETNKKHEIQLSMLNIIQFFIILSTNDEMVLHFFSSKLHQTLYNAIKFIQPVFTQNNSQQKIWAKEPLICQQMVTLICRILSAPQIDYNLAVILLSDFMFLLERKSFQYIYNVIMPILNSENISFLPVCIHRPLSLDKISQAKLQFKEFVKLNNQSHSFSDQLRIQSDILSFDQREEFGTIFQRYFKGENQVEMKKSYKKEKQSKIKILSEYEISDFADIFQVFLLNS